MHHSITLISIYYLGHAPFWTKFRKLPVKHRVASGVLVCVMDDRQTLMQRISSLFIIRSGGNNTGDPHLLPSCSVADR